MSKNGPQQKIKDRFEETIVEDILRYDGSLLDIDYFGLYVKATSKDKLYKFAGLNCCMFNFVYEHEDSVLLLFSIPLGEDCSTKHIADKVMEVTELMESCFITVDYINSREIKDDKFVYMSVVKTVDKDNMKNF